MVMIKIPRESKESSTRLLLYQGGLSEPILGREVE